VLDARIQGGGMSFLRAQFKVEKKKQTYFILVICIAGYVVLSFFLLFELIRAPQLKEAAIRYLVLMGLLNSTVMVYYIVKLFGMVMKLSNQQGGKQ
jgi:hypothetical protein